MNQIHSLHKTGLLRTCPKQSLYGVKPIQSMPTESFYARKKRNFQKYFRKRKSRRSTTRKTKITSTQGPYLAIRDNTASKPEKQRHKTGERIHTLFYSAHLPQIPQNKRIKLDLPHSRHIIFYMFVR